MIWIVVALAVSGVLGIGWALGASVTAAQKDLEIDAWMERAVEAEGALERQEPEMRRLIAIARATAPPPSFPPTYNQQQWVS